MHDHIKSDAHTLSLITWHSSTTFFGPWSFTNVFQEHCDKTRPLRAESVAKLICRRHSGLAQSRSLGFHQQQAMKIQRMKSAVTYTPRGTSDNRPGRAESEPKWRFGLSQPKDTGCWPLVVVAAGWRYPGCVRGLAVCVQPQPQQQTAKHATKMLTESTHAQWYPCPKNPPLRFELQAHFAVEPFGSFRLRGEPFY